MIEPSSLYHLEAEAAQQPQHAPLLHVSLEGFMDAGNVRSQVTEHLLEHLEHTVVASFDMDSLIDYRSRRPLMTFDRDNYSSFEEPSLTLYRVIDRSGQPFLLLDGMEPDFHWEAFTKAVHQVCLGFGVRRMVSAHGVPMAVPHTRPIGLFAHANDPDLLGRPNTRPTPAPGTTLGSDEDEDSAEIVVPAAFGALLELQLGRADHASMGYAAQIPHYLTRTDFPAGALALLRRVSEAAGLDLPLVHLGDLTDAATVALQGTIAQNAEVGQIVSALEEQYDSMNEGADDSPLTTTMDLPTAEELGEHFERFLADHDGEGPGDAPQL